MNASKRVSAKIQMRLSAISHDLQNADLLDDSITLSTVGDGLFDEHVKPTLALTGRKIDEKLRFCRVYVANVYFAYLKGKAVHASRNSSVTKKRRMSKEGRFLRVHFRTGMILDLVPPGSLASGMELCKDGPDKGRWAFVRPRIDQVWKEFKGKRLSKAK